MPTTHDCLAESVKVLDAMLESVSKKHITIPEDSFKDLTGIILLSSKKGAVGVGFETGTGVAIPIGTNIDFSFAVKSPVPLKLSKVTVGVQLGFNTIYTIMLFKKEKQLIELVASPTTIIGTDLNVNALIPYQKASSTAVNIGAAGGTLYGEGQPPDLDCPVKVLSVSDSYMLTDFSLYGGGLSVDTDLLEEMYGKKAEPDVVLDGHSVPTPEAYQQQMASILASLNKLAGK
ncbi:hypothetical protein HYH03_010125 [Edaphochlamys debaryana]|uniref:Ysc84 actin-binding domain-containing protein n=1 Tax=Edaphochlamys debaryana TaxID=47281 RepID=A0A835Y007_9CHLO|nr:hypothetical protein HYH03_010125 [Edaphochlamys debaryana]|eukprot:KAG2491556.1 hypothetical protein HYH03_010125 [Edaphochlamys debaryana]